MRVLLVNTNRIEPPIAPIGLDYVGSALEQAGHEVRLLDLCWSDDDRAAASDAFSDVHFDLVGLSFRNTDDCYFASKCSFVSILTGDVALVREFYDGPVVVGGCGFSMMPVPLLEETGADYGIRGEGEAALPALLDALAGRVPLDAVPGLVHSREGAWVMNDPAYADVASLSLSARRTIDNARYFTSGGQGGIETKRGCPGKCVYCADPVIKGKASRLRPPDDVVAEIRSLLVQGVDVLHTCDSEFNMPVEHAVEVCRAVIEAGLGENLRWYAYMSPSPVTRELLLGMKRAGCVGVNFGVDSGSDAMLRRLGRRFGRREILATAKLCRELEMVFMFDLLIGAPGESANTLRETLDLAQVAAPDCVGVSAGVRVYPGTPLAGQLARREMTGDPATLEPAFYLSPGMGPEPYATVREMIGEDPRFFLPGGGDERDYNYNDNIVLQNAIDSGARGAYWDILRRLRT